MNRTLLALGAVGVTLGAAFLIGGVPAVATAGLVIAIGVPLALGAAMLFGPRRTEAPKPLGLTSAGMILAAALGGAGASTPPTVPDDWEPPVAAGATVGDTVALASPSVAARDAAVEAARQLPNASPESAATILDAASALDQIAARINAQNEAHSKGMVNALDTSR